MNYRAANNNGVAIARAIVSDPTLIVADEPTGDLGSRIAGQILHLLGRCVMSCKTIILVTHDGHAAAKAKTLCVWKKAFWLKPCYLLTHANSKK